MKKRTEHQFHVPEDMPTGYFGHLILLATLLFLLVAIIWANYAVLDEITYAQGEVIPSRQVQIVQNLEGGIVKKVLVKEGDVVKKGQVLMYLDDTQFDSEYETNQLKKKSLMVKLERLKSEVQGKLFKPTKALKKKASQFVASEQALYESKQKELVAMLQRKKLLEHEIAMTKPLIAEGAVSKVEVLQLKQRLNEAEGKINRFRSHSLNELNKVKAELAQVREINRRLKDRLERTVVRSPVDGVVKQIYVNTIGGVARSGMPLAEIVPLEDTLLVEAKVKPQDIGFIAVGQPAIVKLSAYDFTTYGGLRGTVEHISADTIRDKEDQTYYEIRVRTKKSYLGSESAPLAIIPGMQATVDILTGRKSILQYILRPILRAGSRALRER